MFQKVQFIEFQILAKPLLVSWYRFSIAKIKNKMTCIIGLGLWNVLPDQPGPVHALFARHSVIYVVAKGPKIFQADSEDWSDCADAQADLSLCWAHVIL